jgi:GNAT superfamily N-acetyltransferase
VQSKELNALFASAWPGRRGAVLPVRQAQGPERSRGLRPTQAGCSKTAPLRQALVYVCAYEGKRLVGFAKVVGDGGVHGFLLDPTVAPDRQRKGIGRRLVARCAEEARRRGVEWLHVDFESRLAKFYRACGFSLTNAGLFNLKP